MHMSNALQENAQYSNNHLQYPCPVKPKQKSCTKNEIKNSAN